MNKAQKAFQKLLDCIGNPFFYITLDEIKTIEEKLIDAPAPVVKKEPAKKSGKK